MGFLYFCDFCIFVILGFGSLSAAGDFLRAAGERSMKALAPFNNAQFHH